MSSSVPECQQLTSVAGVHFHAMICLPGCRGPDYKAAGVIRGVLIEPFLFQVVPHVVTVLQKADRGDANACFRLSPDQRPGWTKMAGNCLCFCYNQLFMLTGEDLLLRFDSE